MRPRAVYLVSLLAAVVVALTDVISRSLVAFTVSGSSMEPTLYDGDTVLAYCRPLPHAVDRRFGLQSRRSISVLELGADGGSRLIVKRVVAVAGDSVEVDVETGSAVVRCLDRSVARRSVQVVGQHQFEAGSVFAVGDNLGRSWDSRSPDFVRIGTDDLVGVVVGVVGRRERGWCHKSRKLGLAR